MADRTDDGPDREGGYGPPSYPRTEGREGGAPPGYPPPGGGYGPPGSYPGGGGPHGYRPGSGVPPDVYASYWPRVGGWLVDFVIVWIASILVSIPLRTSDVARFTLHTHTGSVTRTGHFSGLEPLAEIVIVLVYGAVFCGSSRGQTPGMMLVGVRAVDRDTGGRIGFGRALWRGLAEYILFVVLFVPWILDMLFPLWDARHQTLHDKLSKTVVVKASLFPPVPPP